MTRKHLGINQQTGKLKKGYKYTGKKLKSEITQVGGITDLFLTSTKSIADKEATKLIKKIHEDNKKEIKTLLKNR